MTALISSPLKSDGKVIKRSERTRVIFSPVLLTCGFRRGDIWSRFCLFTLVCSLSSFITFLEKFCFQTRDPESDQRAVRGINAGEPERNGNLPVHGVQRVRLVVVSPLVMSHVDRDRRVEGGEERVGGCRSREQSHMKGGGRGDFKKGETFQRSRAKRREFQSKLSTFLEHIGSIKREKWNK